MCKVWKSYTLDVSSNILQIKVPHNILDVLAIQKMNSSWVATEVAAHSL